MSVNTVEDAYQFALKAEEKLARKKSNEEEVKSHPQLEVRDLPMTRHIILRTRMKKHTVTRKEEEVNKEERVVEEVILEEEEEEEEEK
jgi:hypothetical protein